MKNFILDTLKVLSLGLMLSLFVAGCSLFGSKEEAPVVAPVAEAKKETVIAERPRVSNREPSSLWSDTSRWNGLYGQPAGRGNGSVVLLKPTDGFRLRVANRSGNRTGGVESASIRENQNVVASVTEVLPNGIVAIAAKQSITVGVREHAFDMTAKLREADIGVDESASTDSLFDINLKVEGEGTRDVASVPGDKKDEKKDEKKAPEAEKTPAPAKDEREEVRI